MFTHLRDSAFSAASAVLGATLWAALFCSAPASHLNAAEPEQLLQLERQYELSIVGEWNFGGGEILGETAEGSIGQRQYRLTSVDALTGSEVFQSEPEKHEIRPLFRLNRYVIVQDGIYNRVSIIDRKTGKRTASKRLAQLLLGAWEDNGVLLALQNSRLSRGCVLSRFSLPEMKFLGEKELPEDIGCPRLINGQLVGIRTKPCEEAPCQPDLVAYTLDGSEVGSTRLPMEPYEGNHCGQEIGVGSGARLVVRMECGQYAVIDLYQKQVLYRLPEYRDALFYDVAIDDDLLFVRPHRGHDTEVRIIDSESGLELARTELPQGLLFASGGKLILKPKQEARSWSVYSINRSAIRTPGRARREVLEAARRADAAPDPYDALGAYTSVSLAPILEEAPDQMDNELFAAATHYGRNLALNPARAMEGADLLARLAANRPSDGSLRSLADAAARRATYLQADPDLREAALSEAWADVDHRPLGLSIIGRQSIHFGAFSDQIYFHDRRVFVACWACNNSTLVSIEVFDRSDWRHLASLPIMQFDEEKQQSIRSIAFAGGRIFASIGSRYPSNNDVNLIVFDLQTLRRVGEVSIPENGASLFSGEGIVGVCSEEFDRCRQVDAASLRSTGLEWDGSAWRNADLARNRGVPFELARSPLLSRLRLVQVDSRYLVTDVGVWPDHVYEFHSLRGEGDEIRFPVPVSDAHDIFFRDDGAHVIIGHRLPEMIRLYAFDLTSKETRILIELPNRDFRGAVSDGRALFAIFGRTVMAIDMANGQIIDWADLFGATEGQAWQHREEIDRLLIDEQKLVILTRSGPARILNLARFHELSHPMETPYAATASALSE